MEKKKNQCCSWVPELPADLSECSNTNCNPAESGWPVVEDKLLFEKYLNDERRLISKEEFEQIMLCKPASPSDLLIALIKALRKESLHFEEVKGVYAPRWIPEHVAELLIEQAYYLGKGDYNKARELEETRKRQHP